jgi:putative ABC transport system substrate-binding protein
MPAIGFLSSRSPGESAGVVAAFRQGLRETGFVEGRNLAIAFRVGGWPLRQLAGAGR